MVNPTIGQHLHEQHSKAGSGPSRNVSVCQGRHAFENLIIEHEYGDIAPTQVIHD